MSELRQDRTTGAWVIIAPKRGERPHARAADARAKSRPRYDANCPFCPGNEAQLPGLIDETPAQDAPGWRLRVVPNKYPALQLEQAAPAVDACGHRARPGHGMHEVIIESPWHDAELERMSADELGAVVGAYRERSRKLLAQEDIAAAILFRNHGRDAGASLLHPHAQIIALDLVPPKLAGMSAWAKRYHDERGACVLCDELVSERKAGTRVVDENDAFLALVPFAAEHPFELWIMPKRHQTSFTALDNNALPAFAALLGSALRRLCAALDDPPYNFVIDAAPKNERDAPHWHWKLRIVADVATWGGFELGGGLPINPSSPEDDARLLRAALPGGEGRR
jgi:UDPglucose--hexose-1-phosphate uridylyltransferase